MLLFAILTINLLQTMFDIQNFFIEDTILLQISLQRTKLIDIADVTLRVKQAMVVLLSMNIDQQRGNLPQNLHRSRATIYLADIFGSQFPGDKQGVIFGLKAHLLDFFADLLRKFGKQRRKIGAVFAAADNIFGQTCA